MPQTFSHEPSKYVFFPSCFLVFSLYGFTIPFMKRATEAPTWSLMPFLPMKKLHWLQDHLIFVSTVLTHIAGGSSGREGAALQLGGSLGNLFGNVIHLDEKDKKDRHYVRYERCVLCLIRNTGSSSYLPAGSNQYRCTVLCSPGSLYFFFFYRSDRQIFRHCREHFTVLSIPAISVSSVGWIIFLSALCAGVSIVFCLMLHGAERHIQENISKSLCAYPGSQCYFYPSDPADRY